MSGIKLFREPQELLKRCCHYIMYMYERCMSLNVGILYYYMADHPKCIFCMFQQVIVVQYTEQCFYWIPRPRKCVCRHQYIYSTLTSTRDIVNLAIFGNGHMADHLKCIFCMFQHVVVVQYNQQCFYWIPHPR